jgi:glutamate/aspartate transport system ATP-binding protein
MIKIDNVSKWYGNFQVLTDCTTQVNEGEVVVICGPSGSGKSTLIKCINGLEMFQKGDVFVDNISVGKLKANLPKLRSRVGMVFQHFELFPHLSVIDNLTIGPIKILKRSKVEARQQGMQLLERVGLQSQAEKYPGQLSGGQQQRLCIARALAVSPQVLLMDEPCSALDPGSTLRIEDTIRELSETMTIVIVTHNMQQAARVSDYTAFFLSDGGPGQMIEYAATSEIFSRPVDQRTENYVTGRFG